MDSRTVTFTRRGATLVLTRERTAEGVTLVATESGRPRTFAFSGLAPLVRFQRDMEDFLCRTGWSMIGAPEAEVPEETAAARTDDADTLRLALAEEEPAAVGAKRYNDPACSQPISTAPSTATRGNGSSNFRTTSTSSRS
jgi:hypothetical protein